MNTLKTVHVLLLLAIAVVFSGCSISKEYTSQIHAEVLKCPEGTAPNEQCVIEYRGPTHLMGGGRVTSVFVSGGQCTYTDANGRGVTLPCGTKNIATAIKGDRIDTLGNSTISAAGDVLSARQLRIGNEYSADAKTREGPGLVILNDNKSSSGSSAGSSAGAVSQQSMEAEMSSSDCSSGGCYDPTQ